VRVAVIGGGISGLTAAHALGTSGHDVACIEPGTPPGGVVRSERHDGFLCETGPQALLDSAPATRRLIEDLGLSARVLATLPTAKRRFLYRDGRLQPLPLSPPALLRSSLLSWRGKLRLLREPFIKRPKAVDPDETVLAFGTRRFGLEAARHLLAPAVIGIYAADAATLAVQAALPRIAGFEREAGSILRGAIAARKQGGGAGKTVSFPDGLQELTGAIATRLGDRLIAGSARAIERRQNRWSIAIDGGPASVDADAVVIAASGAASAALLDDLAPRAAASLRAVPHAPAAVVSLGFHSAEPALGMDLAAYGFIVPREQGIDYLLGCQYETSIFPHRAPEGAVLLRAILGGTFCPDVVNKSDDTIAAIAVDDIGRVAGLNRDPDFVRVWRHPAGLPQYRPGHAALVAAAEADLARQPHLHLIGQTLFGVGVNDCIAAAAALAMRLTA
jgi:oxygen-dependent protoporphyrinogen oxidase